MGTAVGTGVALSYAEEATHGSAVGIGTTKALRATVKNVNLKKDILESAEVSTTRQRADVRHGFNRVEGEIGFELSLNTYNDILAYAMGQNEGNSAYGTSGWMQPASASGNVTAENADANADTTQLVRASGSFIDDGYRPGDWVTLSSFSAGNGDYRVVAIQTKTTVGDRLVIDDRNTTITGGTGTVAYKGRKLIIGKDLKTIALERGFTDVPVFQIFRGCTINTMAMTIQPSAIVGGTFGFLGMSAVISGTSTVLGSATAAPTNSPFSAFDGSAFIASQGSFVGVINVTGAGASAGATQVGLDTGAGESISLKAGDVIKFSDHATQYVVTADLTVGASQTNQLVNINPPLTEAVTSAETVIIDYAGGATLTGLDFTLDNQRTLSPVVGSKFSPDVYEGVAKVTGTTTMLFNNPAISNYFQNEIAPGYISIKLNELGTTDFMNIVFYRVKLTSYDIDPPQNGPVIQTAGFEALEKNFAGTGSLTFKEVMHIQRSV